MSTILTETEGFTPVIDVLAQELGLMTAVVYGIVWRYCQMEDKVCSASRETIAKHTGISIKTVDRHLDKLCKAGYLKDLHPDWKHRPHIYADTGKLKIEALVKVKREGETQSPTSEEGGTESPTTETQSPTGGTQSLTGKTESPTKIPSYDSTHDSQLGKEEIRAFPEKPASDDPVARVVALSQGDTQPEDLYRATAAAQAEGRNYAAPPSAGGADAAAEAALVAMYQALGSQPPRAGTRSRIAEVEIVGKVLRDRGMIEPEEAREAGKRFGRANKEAPQFANVHLSSFPGSFGVYVGIVQDDKTKTRAPPPADDGDDILERIRAKAAPQVKDDEMGQAVKAELALQMTKATFDTWVKPAQFVQEDGVLKVITANEYAYRWLADRLASSIRRAAVGVLGRAVVEVEFEVTP